MWGSKTQRYRSIAVWWIWHQKVFMDEDEKFTVEDIDETLYAVAALAWIWKGEMMLAAIPGINIVEGIVVGGAVASYAIGGMEGVENYIDFITSPTDIAGVFGKGTGEKWEFTKKTIYEEVIKDPVEAAASWYVEKVDRGMDWAEAKVDQGLELLSYGRWANPTPGFGIF